MKSITFLFGWCLSLSFYSQKAEGLYLTIADFNNNKLSYTKNTHCKVRSASSQRSFVKVKCKDSVYTFKKDSLFGYKSTDGTAYRFYGRFAYTILNQGEQILLYRIEKNTGTPKYPKMESFYFFSKEPGAGVQKLSLNNLLSCFSENPEFTKLIEIHFKNSEELTAFDNYHKQYKLNRLFDLSTHEKIK